MDAGQEMGGGLRRRNSYCNLSAKNKWACIKYGSWCSRTCEDLIVAGRWVHLSDKEDHQSSRGCINHRKVGGGAICNVRSDVAGYPVFSLYASACCIIFTRERTALSRDSLPCVWKRVLPSNGRQLPDIDLKGGAVIKRLWGRRKIEKSSANY